MSQQMFLAVLTVMAVLGALAVWSYAFANAYSPHTRAVLTLGATLLPRAWAARPRLRRGGAHRAPAWASIHDFLTSDEMVPGGLLLAYDPAYPDREPLLVAVDERGAVHVTRVDHRPPIERAIQQAIAHVETPLPVRVAEILAHQEAEVHQLEQPERTEAGATETWSPAAESFAARPAAVLAHSNLDPEAQAILDAFALLCDDAYTVPDWAGEWGQQTDAHLEAAGMNSEPHRRWRATLLDSPTGELPRVLLDA